MKVAAYVSTLDEGPYLEALLRWLVRRKEVGAVYVMESDSAWAQEDNQRESRTKGIVDSIQYVDGDARIIYRELKGQQHFEPLVKETDERNQALRIIKGDGYEWIWWVDSDEFYTDFEADALWDWFHHWLRRDNGIRGVRCSWHTYWRSMHWRITPPEPYVPNVIVRSDCVIASSRHMTDESGFVTVPPEVCMARHYSWAKSHADITKKLTTWGHAKEGNLMGWKAEVFDRWTPNCDMMNIHPTEPAAYRMVERCELPVPEALKTHPYNGLELIEGEPKEYQRPRVKAVVLAHNRPEEADSLAAKLKDGFDDVEVIDCGSDAGMVPCSTTVALDNVYWTGAWNHVIENWSDYDAVWMLGDHIQLKQEASVYRKEIEESLPFGCWSPSVSGRAKPFMQPESYNGSRMSVKNVEGMALAVSGELMGKIGLLPKGSDGYGQDLWLCHMARSNRLVNYIDGVVEVYHPEGTGYDDTEFCKQMDDCFGAMYGPDYRRTAFDYSDDFKGNLYPSAHDTFTVVGVDNGFSAPEFQRVVSMMPEVKAVMVRKGVSNFSLSGVSMRDSEDFEDLLSKADAFLFPRVGFCNKREYERVLEAGIPVVVAHGQEGDGVEHEKNALLYEANDWAMRWLRRIFTDSELRDKFKHHNKKQEIEIKEIVFESSKRPLVTFITPTWNRGLDVIRRCLDCVSIQTNEEWEHLVCSNGDKEIRVMELVDGRNDKRLKYHYVESHGQNDYGNTARREMIKKAAGKYVAFLDDDNIVLPAFIEDMVQALEQSGKEFVVCDIVHFGPLAAETGLKAPTVLKGEPVKLRYVDPLQVVVKTEVMREVGWDIETGYLSDGVTLEMLGSGYDHCKLDKVLGFHM